MTTATAPDLLTPRRRGLLLAVIALALMMVVSAVSGLNVALPDLAVDTGATQTQVTWIVDAYTLAFVALLLPAGALGDRYGRKPVLLIGLALFGAAATGALFVDTPDALIGLRAAMGLGAAAVMPVTLSIITTSFPPEERSRAIGVWVGVAGGGAVLGLFASGLLLEFFAWNSFFALNVVLAGLALIGTLLVVPASRDTAAPPLDVVGAVLSAVGLFALVFGIIEGAERGWDDPLVLAALVVAAGGLVSFVLWALRRDRPLLDPRLFRLRGFGMGSLTLTAQFFASFGFFFVALQYLQYVAGLSPLQSAVALLPLPAVLIPLARKAPVLAERFGTNVVSAAGLTLSAAGMLLLSVTLAVDLVYWTFAAGLVVFAAGMGLAGTPATAAIVGSLPAGKQGVASAVNDVSRELGSALGIAVLGSLLTSAYRRGVDENLVGAPVEVAEQVRSSIAATTVAADRLAALGPQGEAVVLVAQQAFVDATGTAFLAAAGTLIVAAVLVAVRAPRRGAPQASASSTDSPTDSSTDSSTDTSTDSRRYPSSSSDTASR